jgi:hypothetical protein
MSFKTILSLTTNGNIRHFELENHRLSDCAQHSLFAIIKYLNCSADIKATLSKGDYYGEGPAG